MRRYIPLALLAGSPVGYRYGPHLVVASALSTGIVGEIPAEIDSQRKLPARALPVA